MSRGIQMEQEVKSQVDSKAEEECNISHIDHSVDQLSTRGRRKGPPKGLSIASRIIHKELLLSPILATSLSKSHQEFCKANL